MSFRVALQIAAMLAVAGSGFAAGGCSGGTDDAIATTGSSASTREGSTSRPDHAQVMTTTVTFGGDHHEARGTAFSLPDSWQVIGNGWTQLVIPTRIGFTSFETTLDLEGDCYPARVLDEMPHDGVALFVIEYGSSSRGGFETRPRTFTLEGVPRVAYECFGDSFAWYFEDEGRFFQAHLAPGPQASEATIRQGVELLNSLRVQPQ